MRRKNLKLEEDEVASLTVAFMVERVLADYVGASQLFDKESDIYTLSSATPTVQLSLYPSTKLSSKAINEVRVCLEEQFPELRIYLNKQR